ncbi:hypothetical protein ABIF60_001577 [Bradyrhizobium japonicum]
MKMPRPSTPDAISAIATPIHHWMLSRWAIVQPVGFGADLVDRLRHLLDDGLDRGEGLRHRLEFDSQSQRGLRPGEEVTLVIGELLAQLGLRIAGNGGLVEARHKLGRALLHVVAVSGVATQHEVLLVPSHHQHGHLERRIPELADLGLDVVDRGPQAAFETGLFIEPEPLSLLDHRGETGLIGLQRCGHRVDPRDQLGLAEP